MSCVPQKLQRSHLQVSFFLANWMSTLLKVRNSIQINELFDLAKFSFTLPLLPLSTSLISTPTIVRIEFSNDPVDEFSKYWGEGCS